MANPNPAILKLTPCVDVNMDKRADYLPVLYRFEGHHPQRPPPVEGVPETATYVQLKDMSKEGREIETGWYDKLRIPVGRDADMNTKYGMGLRVVMSLRRSCFSKA